MNYEFYPIHGAWIQEILALPRDRFWAADEQGRLPVPRAEGPNSAATCPARPDSAASNPSPRKKSSTPRPAPANRFLFNCKTAAAREYFRKLLVYLLSRNDPDGASKAIAQQVIADGTFGCHGNYGCGFA